MWSKGPVDRPDRMGARPRRDLIGTGPTPFAPPWPIYLKTIFPGSGELVSKRGGGQGDSNFDGQIDGQIIRVRKMTFPGKIGKSEGTSKIQF